MWTGQERKKFTPEEMAVRQKLYRKAQRNAQTQLVANHRSEYQTLYALHRDRLLREAGLPAVEQYTRREAWT